MLDNIFAKETVVGALAALALLGFVRWQSGRNLGA